VVWDGSDDTHLLSLSVVARTVGYQCPAVADREQMGSDGPGSSRRGCPIPAGAVAATGGPGQPATGPDPTGPEASDWLTQVSYISA
jgi:hypothetical protein